MRFPWLGAKIDSALTDVGMGHFFYNNGKIPSQLYRSKDKRPRALKRFVYKLLRFRLRRTFVGRIGIVLLTFTPLPSPDTFYNHASWSQKEKILRLNKNAGQQADLAS